MMVKEMGVGSVMMSLISPAMERMAPYVPGEIFPSFFTVSIFQNALVAALLVSMVAAFLGSFLIIRNLSLIGDGLAHVTFGGVAVGIVIGATSPLGYALVFSVVCSLLIHELQARGLLTGDAAIAIFSTGALALGLVFLSYWGGGITNTVEGYLFGNILLINSQSFEIIVWMSIVSMSFLGAFRHILLAMSLDPISLEVQGIPVGRIGRAFSIITAVVVVCMVQFIGALLVTALLVTPAATGQIVSKSFRSCLIWSQVFALSSTILGIFISAELEIGTGSTIALVSVSIFLIAAFFQMIVLPLLGTETSAR
ncbi:MAG: hypothetical protein CL500_00190 [Actinobacteria bacterium]|nr:hypothetical protein [Actinomycetota bacterium]